MGYGSAFFTIIKSSCDKGIRGDARMSGWEIVTLEDVTVDGSQGLKRGPFGGAIKKDSFVPDGYKIYEQKHAIYGNFDSGDYFISEARYKELKSFAVESGDLIVSCSGTLGRVAVVPPNVKPGIINQALLRIRPKSNLVSSRFLKMLLEDSRSSVSVVWKCRGFCYRGNASYQ